MKKVIKGFAFIHSEENIISLPLQPVEVEDFEEANQLFASQGITYYLYLLSPIKEETK